MDKSYSPNKLAALWKQAQELCDKNKLEDALELLTPICSEINDSEYISFLNLAGLIALNLDKNEIGFSWLLKSYKLDPKQVEVNYNLSIIYENKKNYKSAVGHLSKALDLDPRNINCLFNRANIYETLELYEDGLADISKLIRLEQSADVYNLYGLIQNGCKNYNQAINLFKRALDLDPDNIEFMNNLAISHKDNGGLNQAKNILLEAIKINPGVALTLNNLGLVYEEANQLEKAVEYYRKSKDLQENFANSYNLGIAQLKVHDYKNGWKNYESRWEINSFKLKMIRTKKPLWDGSECRSILVWGEQGLGDEIIYSSMLNDLKTYCDNIYYACLSTKTISLFKNSFKKIKVLAMDEISNDDFFDYHIPVASLGQFFRLDAGSFEKYEKYLFADQDLKNKLKEKFNKPLIGISWRSNASVSKNIDLKEFKKLIHPNYQMINLQYQLTIKEKKELNSLGIKYLDLELFDDIDTAAALIDCCEFVITASNINAHLAGALNKKTFLLSASGVKQFHYWMSPTSNSLWYPSVQIVNQQKNGNWARDFELIYKQI
ncbi:TPR repeat protein, putative [beta proteobacterium KB13]|uniref:TPR repeat protein, putative n=1 Tax=beta proteobacterium KB13 TaxID=314607 RepID=B6BWU4_9PROT|nr:TPR repeat protein, putative [beta proteobacterium KB13]